MMDLLTGFPSDFHSCRTETFMRRCDDVADWAEMFSCAAEQGVDGILLQSMFDHGTVVPKEILRTYGGRLAAQHHLHRQLRAIEGRVAQEFAAAGIRALALYGPSFDERIGALEAGRGSASRLSFLVSRQDLAAASALLAEYDGAFIQLRSGLQNGMNDLDVDSILRRAMRYETTWGARLWIPAPEDELILLATDIAARDFGRLAWLYDLRLFIESYCELESGTILGRAVALGIDAVFEGIMELLEDCLGIGLDYVGRTNSWAPLNGSPMEERVAWHLADDVLADAVSTSWGLRLWAQKP